MGYEILDVLTLEDKEDYVIVDICDYQNDKYAFLSNVNDNKKFLYAKLKEDDNILIIGFKNTELIDELNKLFSKDVKKVLQTTSDLLNN